MKVIIRPIEPKDNSRLKKVILEVLLEFGASGEGFASADPELNSMYEEYQNSGRKYWIVEVDGQVVGGGGVAPLKGKGSAVCELQKMYISAAARGLGAGRLIIDYSLQFAEEFGYQSCYLETLPDMKVAQKLYKDFGFEYIADRMGETGHSKCPVFMLKHFT